MNKRRNAYIEVKKLNYNILLNILKEYGIYTHIKQFQISSNNINAREILLFLTVIFQNLQHFQPKDTITFSCILGDSLVKAITLMNPTKKTLEYAIKYEGSDCFLINQGNNNNIINNNNNNNNNSEIKIEPGKELEYPITFKSKLSTKVEGKIYFINRKAGWSNQAAPIVYNLVSNITGRRSVEYKIISTNLYSRFAYKLHVVMPFPKEKGEFEVRAEQKKKLADDLEGAKKELHSATEENARLKIETEKSYRLNTLYADRDKLTKKFDHLKATLEPLEKERSNSYKYRTPKVLNILGIVFIATFLLLVVLNFTNVVIIDSWELYITLITLGIFFIGTSLTLNSEDRKNSRKEKAYAVWDKNHPSYVKLKEQQHDVEEKLKLTKEEICNYS